MKNKRGWIRIIEAVVALLLVTGVLLVVINKGYIGKDDISSRVYDAQLSILREIQLDENLRYQIVSETLIEGNEIVWGDFPEDVKNRITARQPNYLECEAKICGLNNICSYNEIVDKDIYAQSVAIATANEVGSGVDPIYSPRQLKLFCWTL